MGPDRSTQWGARIRFPITSFYIRCNVIWALQTLQVEVSLLIELFPGIHSGIDSEVLQDFNDTSATHIIAISGFNMSSCDALHAREWESLTFHFPLSVLSTNVAVPRFDVPTKYF